MFLMLLAISVAHQKIDNLTLLIFWSPPPTSSLQTLSVVRPTGKSHDPVGIWFRKKLQKINVVEVIIFSVGNTYCL